MQLMFFLLIFFSQSLLAKDKISFFDGENYFATGISEQKSEVLANSEACNSARRELMSYVFGAGYKINQNIVKSMGNIDYSQDVSSQSGDIILRSVQSEVSRINDITKCTLTYPKEQADIELKRIGSNMTETTLLFTEIGSDKNIKTGTLEVITYPEEANVYIDDVRWGVTPIRLNSKLSLGKHIVKIDHANYNIEEVEIDIVGVNKIIIKKLLKRATAILNINTEPSGAKIKMNGVELGKSPLNRPSMLAGQKIHLEIQHPEAENYGQDLELSRDEERDLNIDLPMRPAYVLFNINPSSDVEVEIDGYERINSDLNKYVQISSGAHKISFKKAGYDSQEIEVKLAGGEKRVFPEITLSETVEPEIPDVLLKSTQWGYRPFVHDFHKDSFYILPISLNKFSNNWFSTGLDFRLAMENIGSTGHGNYKYYTNIAINEMFWPIHNQNFSFGIGVEFNYRTITYDNEKSNERYYRKDPEALKPQKTSSFGGIVDLQIPIWNWKNKCIGMEFNYRRLDLKKKTDGGSIGFYYEY